MSICNCRPIEYSSAKIGMYVILKSRPCKVTHHVTSKTGKHGSMKVSMMGNDVLTGKKYEVAGAGHMVTYQFDVDRKSYQILSLENNILSCLDDSCNQIEFNFSNDHQLFEELNNKLKGNVDIYVTIVTAPIPTQNVGENAGEFTDEYFVESYKLCD